MTLPDWRSNGWVKDHTSNPQEIKILLEKVDRDIGEAAKEVITLDWRLAIAYNACLGCATIALQAAGYRMPGGTGQHYRTIQSLRFTFDLGHELVILLEAINKKRAVVNCDAAGSITPGEVSEARKLATELKDLLLHWLKNEHPELL